MSNRGPAYGLSKEVQDKVIQALFDVAITSFISLYLFRRTLQFLMYSHECFHNLLIIILVCDMDLINDII